MSTPDHSVSPLADICEALSAMLRDGAVLQLPPLLELNIQSSQHSQPVVTFAADHDTVLAWGNVLSNFRVGSTSSGEFAVEGTVGKLRVTIKTYGYWPGVDGLVTDVPYRAEVEPYETPVTQINPILEQATALPTVA